MFFQIAAITPSEVPKKIERVPSIKVDGVMTYVPWGGTGGSLFDDGIYDGVRQIKVSRNVGIVSIRVCYDQDGQAVWGSRNGGKGAFKSDKVNRVNKMQEFRVHASIDLGSRC